MKVQIFVDGQIVNTQIVSELLNEQASPRDFKRLALKAALEDKAIRVSESFRATFRLFDVMGEPVDE